MHLHVIHRPIGVSCLHGNMVACCCVCLCLAAGMNVVRLNMSHGSHDSHRGIVELVAEYNATHHNCLATMLDTKVRVQRTRWPCAWRGSSSSTCSGW